MRNASAALTLLALGMPTAAQADDLSTYLAGRWGGASTTWKMMEPRATWYACTSVPGGPDTAMTFSGRLGAITVTTNNRIGTTTPLTAPLTVGNVVKYDGNIHPGHLASARMIVEVEFMRRGAMGTSVTVKGWLGMVAPDRFVIAESGKGPYAFYMMRCPR